MMLESYNFSAYFHMNPSRAPMLQVSGSLSMRSGKLALSGCLVRTLRLLQAFSGPRSLRKLGHVLPKAPFQVVCSSDEAS